MPVRPLELPIQGLDDHDSVALEDLYVPNLRNVRSDRGRIVTAPGGTLLAPAPIPGAGFGMITGVFTTPGATGNQVVTHNLGATPKALLLYTSGATALSTTQANLHYSVGMTDGTTSRVAGIVSANTDPSSMARRYANGLVTIIDPGTLAAVSECGFVAWSSTTFTVNWTVVDGNARYVAYAVLGHAALTAKLLEWTFGAATGNQAVAGAGLTPTLVIHLSAALGSTGTSANAQFSMGAMTGSNQIATSAAGVNGVSPRQDAVANRTDKAITCVNSTATGIQFDAAGVSLDVDGFTVNRTTAPASGVLVASLCIAGFSNLRLDTFGGNSVTVPGRSAVASLPFQPTGLIQFGSNRTSFGTGGFDLLMGAADGANQSSAAVNDSQVGPGASAHIRSDDFYVDADLVGQGVNGSGIDFLYQWISFDTAGLTTQIIYSPTSPVGAVFQGIAFSLPPTGTGVIRNYGDLIVGGATPTEKIVMLTSKSAFVYTASTSSTGVFGSTAETYTGTDVQRFSIANGTDSAFGAVAAWSQGTNNIRAYTGAFSGLITSGTNHAARTLLAFNSRIVSVRPFFGGVDHKTQIRWCINGTFNDWAGTGSGTLEVVETSNQPLTSGVVIGGKCYLTRAREIVELIATGSLSPVFVAEPRVPGVGCIATHSMAAGDIYAFWLGPDEVYQWDGSQLKAVGGKVYNTISSLVDYENLDQIQAVVYEPDSQYWLVVPPYVFVYDYRRQIWDWDDTRSFQAIGRLTVQDLFTADIDHSEFVVIGDSSVQTIRVDPSVNTYLGAPIDAYFETKDLLPYGKEGRQWAVAYDKYNSLWRVWFRGTPGERIEVAASTDKGLTYPSVNTRIVTVNAAGVGIAFFDMAWGVLRLRFRSQAGSVYSIQGNLQAEWQEAGVMLP